MPTKFLKTLSCCIYYSVEKLHHSIILPSFKLAETFHAQTESEGLNGAWAASIFKVPGPPYWTPVVG